jgi:hypothetical protein
MSCNLKFLRASLTEESSLTDILPFLFIFTPVESHRADGKFATDIDDSTRQCATSSRALLMCVLALTEPLRASLEACSWADGVIRRPSRYTGDGRLSLNMISGHSFPIESLIWTAQAAGSKSR